jgi:hypothetical protein
VLLARSLLEVREVLEVLEAMKATTLPRAMTIHLVATMARIKAMMVRTEATKAMMSSYRHTCLLEGKWCYRESVFPDRRT